MTIDFPPDALPFAAVRRDDGRRHLGLGLGTDVVDLGAAAARGDVASLDPALLSGWGLDALLAAGHEDWTALHEELGQLVAVGAFDDLRTSQADVHLDLAWTVADYVDGYASLDHASNVGRMFRPDDPPLLPNWRHLPVGYHGRAGTVVVDGTPVRRPVGHVRDSASGEVVVRASAKLDLELELGYVCGNPTVLGEPVPIDRAQKHLFGVVLLNDWSARDVQAYEYVPLGPYLGKSFATSVSAWVLPFRSLRHAEVPPPHQDPTPAEHLRDPHGRALAFDLRAVLRPHGADAGTTICRVDAGTSLYWTAAQQLTHLASNGATVRAGDLLGSGTISGPEPGQRGSLLETSWNGRDVLDVDGHDRTFLEDGDTVVLSGAAPGADGPLPLGPVGGTVLPAR